MRDFCNNSINEKYNSLCGITFESTLVIIRCFVELHLYGQWFSLTLLCAWIIPLVYWKRHPLITGIMIVFNTNFYSYSLFFNLNSKTYLSHPFLYKFKGNLSNFKVKILRMFSLPEKRLWLNVKADQISNLSIICHFWNINLKIA